jgi:hypothetical protein
VTGIEKAETEVRASAPGSKADRRSVLDEFDFRAGARHSAWLQDQVHRLLKPIDMEDNFDWRFSVKRLAFKL